MEHTFTHVKHGSSWPRYVLLITLILAASAGWAQNIRQITGKILSKTDGKGLPGANVLVKGSSVGAVTDAEGAFTLSAAPNSTLTVSYIGFIPQEIALGSQTQLTISLVEDASQLNEVVVTASRYCAGEESPRLQPSGPERSRHYAGSSYQLSQRPVG